METATTLGNSDDSGYGTVGVGDLSFYLYVDICLSQEHFSQIISQSHFYVHNYVSLAQVVEKNVDPEMMLLPYLRKNRILCCVL